MTPSEIILRKSLVAAGNMSTADLDRISTAIKDRAFFSANVESIRFLDTCRTRIAELLDNARNGEGAITSRAQAVSDIMHAARASGISTGMGGLRDPGSSSRAAVIVDTNAGLSAGYVAAEQANTYGARLAFPAQELVRIEEREVPRNWPAIWRGKGGKLYQGRMIALKEDPIWIAISRFGHPHPPFDFNSGMGLDDVSYDEAVELGVISPDYQPPEKSPIKDFNDGLEIDLQMDRSSEEFRDLKERFGDQIVLKNGKAVWRSQFVRDCIEDGYGEKGRLMKLGAVTNNALDKVPDELKHVLFGSKGERMGLTITKELATHIKDHQHYKEDPRPTNMPLMPEDLDLMPTLWRDPDRVVKDEEHPESPVFELDTADGGVLRLPIISIGNSITTGTLYKKKQPR